MAALQHLDSRFGSRNAVYDFDYVDVRGVAVIMWSVFCNMNERVSAVRRNGEGGWLVAPAGCTGSTQTFFDVQTRGLYLVVDPARFGVSDPSVCERTLV